MQTAYVRSPMEYVVNQKADFDPTIDWNLVASFDEYLTDQIDYLAI